MRQGYTGFQPGQGEPAVGFMGRQAWEELKPAFWPGRSQGDLAYGVGSMRPCQDCSDLSATSYPPNSLMSTESQGV